LDFAPLRGPLSIVLFIFHRMSTLLIAYLFCTLAVFDLSQSLLAFTGVQDRNSAKSYRQLASPFESLAISAKLPTMFLGTTEGMSKECFVSLRRGQ
jgi:succinate dehydrogenase/fumarate reductase cytochrome b subunit